MVFKKRIKFFLSRIIPKRVIMWETGSPEKIALTFDDGPHHDVTPKVLDILKKKQVKATFFFIGNNVLKYREIARRVVEEGHTVGMHSLEHRRYKDMNIRARQHDLKKTKKIFKDILEIEPRIFRPPQGNIKLTEIIKNSIKGITTVLWSLDTLDYKLEYPEQILTLIKSRQLKHGEIFLMHDDASKTAEFLGELIEHIKKEGFSFTTIGDVLR